MDAGGSTVGAGRDRRYRRACERGGREAGEVALQVPISWAEDDEQALESAREWKATLGDEHVTEPIHDPAEIQRNGREIRNGDRA